MPVSVSVSVSVSVPLLVSVFMHLFVSVSVPVSGWVSVSAPLSVSGSVCGYADGCWPFSCCCLLVCLFVGLLVPWFACLSLSACLSGFLLEFCCSRTESHADFFKKIIASH